MFTRRLVIFGITFVQWLCCSVVAAQSDCYTDAYEAGSSLAECAIAKLSDAIKIKTVSRYDSTAVDYETFLQLHAHLEHAFPLVHRHLQREVVNSYSLLYTWPGSDNVLNPLLFTAHLDVVPVEEASLANWDYDPFSGIVAEGHIWGRGTMDDKYRVIAILEAIEQLLQRGYKPERTILLAFGHDEEIGGNSGAGEIDKLLAARNVRLAAVFDEGLAVTERMMPAIERPIAFIGTASKGNISFLLTVNGEGGHSSIPPDDTPISVLSQALYRINQNQFKSRITPTTRKTLNVLSHEMGGMYRFSMKFYWLLKGIIRNKLAKNQATDAIIRTKVAPTIIQAGDKSNILPRIATAVINVRILTGETDKSVLAYLKKVINDDRVLIEQYGYYTPPSPDTSTDTWMYRTLEATIMEIFPDAAVAPALFPGATDARHFSDRADNVFLFAPQVVTPENGTLIHNVNERIAIDVFERCIMFYISLLQNMSWPVTE